MWLLRLAWKNLWRNKSRTFITMSAIYFAVVLAVLAASLKTGVFENLVKNMVGFYAGYIQVHRQGYQDEQILDNAFASSTEIEYKILSDNNVTAIAPRIESFALAASDELTKGCMVVGIDPVRENEITSLKSRLVAGKYIDANDKSILLTQGISKRFKLNVNDTIVLIGQGYHGATAAGKYRVGGIVKFGAPQLNDRMLFMPLKLAQDFFSADGMLTSYVLSIANEKKLHATDIIVQQQLGNDYEVMTWEEMLPDVRQHITTDTRNMKIIQGILYMLISFGIFSTLLMMMIERRFEMGMMIAIGMKKSKLALLLIVESVLTVLIGCIAGLVTSAPLVYIFNRYPVHIGGETGSAFERFGFEAIFPTSTDPSILLMQGIIVLLIGFVLSVYPLFRIAKLEAVTAMRK